MGRPFFLVQKNEKFQKELPTECTRNFVRCFRNAYFILVSDKADDGSRTHFINFSRNQSIALKPVQNRTKRMDKCDQKRTNLTTSGHI